MAEIARQLGISRTTVSLILKGEAERFRISPATRDRVLSTVKHLGYKPNYFAKALNQPRTGVVGIVLPNVFEAFMSEVVKGIEDVLYPEDYTMTLCTSRFDQELERRLVEQLCYRRVDGLLLMPTAPFRGEHCSYAHIHTLCGHQTPFVFIDRYLDNLAAHRVTQDDFGGAYHATEALVHDGCTRIGYVSLDIDVTSIRQRRAGFLKALKDLGMSLPRDRTVMLKKSDPTSDDLSKALGALLAGPDRPDGLFVSTQGISLKVRHLAQQAGLMLNRDIRVARFGSDPLYHPTGMYCVEQPHTEMGRQAAKLLLKTIRSEPPSTPCHITLSPHVYTPATRSSDRKTKIVPNR